MIQTSPGDAERLSIRTTPAWPSDAADGTYGTVCSDSAAHMNSPDSADTIAARCGPWRRMSITAPSS